MNIIYMKIFHADHGDLNILGNTSIFWTKFYSSDQGGP